MSGHPTKQEPRQTGTASQGKNAIDTSSIPDLKKTQKRPMTPDEKVDQASMESMDASDPPAFQPSSTGASPDRKSDHKPTGKPPKH